jgi:hypothetical protein
MYNFFLLHEKILIKEKQKCALCKHLKWFVNFCNFFAIMHFCELLQWIKYHVLRIFV